MLRSLKELIGYRIAATDGEIGKIVDFYFDDASWRIRYLVAATGSWLFGRQVLVSPASVGLPDHERRIVPVALTVKQVAGSPPVDTDLPVSRQHEIKLASYYNWPPYWPAAGTPVAGMGIAAIPDAAMEHVDHPGDPHLRSAEVVSAYSIHTTDRDVGHAVDFLVDTDTWRIRYLVASTRDVLPGKKVLVAADWLTAIDWAGREVRVNVTFDQFKGGEAFDPSKPVDRDVETRLFDYYGRPKYWETENPAP
jgi:hypothetical protein